MRRLGLPLATCLSLAVSGVLTSQANYRPARAESRRAASAGLCRRDRVSEDVEWRWRMCEPHHWRACMLRH